MKREIKDSIILGLSLFSIIFGAGILYFPRMLVLIVVLNGLYHLSSF